MDDLKVFGRASVYDFLADRVVYRNLVPYDKHLPSLQELRQIAGLPTGIIPRKSETAYAQVIVQLLRRAFQHTDSRASIDRLVFIGDTRLNDSTAFINICRAGDWPGIAFIGSDSTDPPKVEIVSHGDHCEVYLSNRWSLLTDFNQYCLQHGMIIDEHTAVIIDLDKTALGARGRNDHTIDLARVQAVSNTVSDLLSDEFDAQSFQTAYNELNQVEFHDFTTDNQDYLAYICLIIGSGMYSLAEIVSNIRSQSMTTFRQFIERVEDQSLELSFELAEIHAEIYANVQVRDPTPFKPFRRREYQTTIARMGNLDDRADIQDLLAQEILLTQEVRRIALNWQTAGALLFGMSDKPDEASIPTETLASQGYLPIHQTATHAVGT